MLEWRSGPLSAAFDLHLRLCFAAHTALHVAPSGGGWFSNVWGWGCDHNLTDNTDNTPHLSADTHWLGALSGIRLEASPGPTYLVGTAFEHHRRIQYNLTGAINVTIVAAQTENAYWPAGGKQPGQPSPACDAKAFQIANASHISAYGNVWCGWFCHVDGPWAHIDSGSHAIALYGVWSVGADTVAGDPPGPAKVAAFVVGEHS